MTDAVLWGIIELKPDIDQVKLLAFARSQEAAEEMLLEYAYCGMHRAMSEDELSPKTSHHRLIHQNEEFKNPSADLGLNCIGEHVDLDDLREGDYFAVADDSEDMYARFDAPQHRILIKRKAHSQDPDREEDDDPVEDKIIYEVQQANLNIKEFLQVQTQLQDMIEEDSRAITEMYASKKQ